MSQNGVFMRCVSACKCAFGDLQALFKSPYYSDFNNVWQTYLSTCYPVNQ